MNNLKQLHVALAVLLLGGTHQLCASTWEKSTVMSTTELIVAGDKLLPPGSYVWKLLDSPSNRHIVQISDQKTGHVETTIIAVPNYRQHVTGDNVFQFWEAPKGLPQAVRSWFYPGDNYGQEFAYPEAVMASLAAARPVATPVLASPMLAVQPVIKKVAPVTHLAAVQSAKSAPQTAAANGGSWAVVTNGVKPVKKVAATPKTHIGIWDGLKSLPLTATLAPLVGLIGLASLILWLMSYLKRRNKHQVAS
jgi:hypothetical protein